VDALRTCRWLRLHVDCCVFAFCYFCMLRIWRLVMTFEIYTTY
jgi:hypothetical protein